MMKQKIEVLRLSTSENDYGEQTGTRTTVTTFGGSLRTVSAAEVSKSGLEYGLNTVSITATYTTSLDKINLDDLFRIKSEDYQILSIDNMNLRSKTMTFMARRLT